MTAVYVGMAHDIKVALHAACHFKAKDVIYLLLEKGADPNISGVYLGSSSGATYPEINIVCIASPSSDCKLASSMLPRPCSF
jgi:ankyrin repeat protein